MWYLISKKEAELAAMDIFEKSDKSFSLGFVNPPRKWQCLVSRSYSLTKHFSDVFGPAIHKAPGTTVQDIKDSDPSTGLMFAAIAAGADSVHPVAPMPAFVEVSEAFLNDRDLFQSLLRLSHVLTLGLHSSRSCLPDYRPQDLRSFPSSQQHVGCGNLLGGCT